MVGKVPKGSKEEESLNKIYEFDMHVRGKYTIQANWIDYYLAEVISMHFFPDVEEDHRLLHSIINNQIGFIGKINTFETILKLYPDLEKKFPKIVKKIDKIREFRNKIAHSVLDTSDAFLNKNQFDRIRLQFNKNGKEEYYEITKELIDTKLNETSVILEQLLIILESIEKKHLDK